jgi:hypothetical protein
MNNTDFKPEEHLLPCPFSSSCILPKRASTCNFPNYKVCAEYDVKVKKLKPRMIL